MLSGSNDDTQIVSTLAFDADGSLYSVLKYMRLCIAILDKYWDQVRQYGNANSRSLDDEAEIKKIVESMLREIAAIDLTHVVGTFKITNPTFRQAVEKNIKQLSILFKQRASRIEAIRMVLATYIPMLNCLDERILKSIFIQANKDLFVFLAEVLQRDRVAGYALAFATNRQSFFLEKLAMDRNGTDSFHCNVYEVLDFISTQCPTIACMLNDVTLADLFAAHNPGNNFVRGLAHKKIREEFRHRASNPNSILHEDHPACVFDESKIMLVYLLAHDTAINLARLLKLPLKKYYYRIELVDNEMEILTTLRDTLLANRDLLPEGVTVNLYFYAGILQKTLFASITGTGQVDQCYPENTIKMARMCGHDGKDFGKNIHVAKELDVKKFLRERIVTIQSRIITDNPAVLFSGDPQIKKQRIEAQQNPSQRTEGQPNVSPDYQPL